MGCKWDALAGLRVLVVCLPARFGCWEDHIINAAGLSTPPLSFADLSSWNFSRQIGALQNGEWVPTAGTGWPGHGSARGKEKGYTNLCFLIRRPFCLTLWSHPPSVGKPS